MGEEVVEAENPQLAFAIIDETGQPVAEPLPTKPLDISPERMEALQKEAQEAEER
jgi:hypothetical protein